MILSRGTISRPSTQLEALALLTAQRRPKNVTCERKNLGLTALNHDHRELRSAFLVWQQKLTLRGALTRMGGLS